MAWGQVQLPTLPENALFDLASTQKSVNEINRGQMANDYTRQVQPAQIDMLLASMRGLSDADSQVASPTNALASVGAPPSDTSGLPSAPATATPAAGRSLLVGPTPTSADPATQQFVGQVAAEKGVNPDWAMRVHYAESGKAKAPYGPGTTSPTGARGPMQLMPGTAAELGVNPDDLHGNVTGGVTYLAQMKAKFGDPVLATAAYNAGPGRVDAFLSGKASLPPETVNYVGKVFGTGDGMPLLNAALSGAHGHPIGGVQVAGPGAPVGAPDVSQRPGGGLEPVQQDQTARNAVRQLVMQQRYWLALPEGKGAHAAAAIQTQLDNIAGPGGIVDPRTGNVYRVPGGFATRYAAANAAEAGKYGPSAALHQQNAVTDVQKARQTPVQMAPEHVLTTPETVLPPANLTPGAPMAPLPPGGPPPALNAGQGVTPTEAPTFTGTPPPGQPVPGPTGAPAPVVLDRLRSGQSGATPAPVAPVVANQPRPGVYQAPPAPGKVAIAAYERDAKELPAISDAGQQAQSSQIRLAQARDLAAKLSSGSGGQTRAQWANLAETMGMPGVAKALIGNASGGDAAAAQEFAKQMLQASGQQERGVMGSRGGYQAMKLFQSANPGLDLQPDANRKILNMQLIGAQADADYAAGAMQHVNQQIPSVHASGPYAPLSVFDQQWQQQRNPQVYAAAIGALNGEPFDKWKQGLSKMEVMRAVDVIRRASPNSTVLWADGKPHSFGQAQ